MFPVYHDRPKLRLPPPSSSSATTSGPLISLQGKLWSTPHPHLTDTWHFEYFRTVSVRELSLCLGTQVWGSVILPAAFTESFVLSGILALAALSRNMAPSPVSGRMTLWSGHPVSYALYKYNQSIRELNARLDSSPGSREFALLGSLIFTVIETLRGREDLAHLHLRSALAIRPDHRYRGESFDPRVQLMQTIAALASSPSFDHIRSSNQLIHSPLTSQLGPPLPSSFASICEARDALNVITGAIKTVFWKQTAQPPCQPTNPHRSQADHARHMSVLIAHLNSWKTNFASLVAHSTIDPETQTCIQALLVHHKVHGLHISAYSQPVSLIQSDSYTIQFASIIELCENIIRTEQHSRATKG
ncbi:hypothetical protein GGR57DRAFT_507135 [Xylariaceae sp. FL1272]|nr:hypothetical protein GGR57DRAFT_507135 [Xylariaceae sp. FL1272]